MNRDLIFAAIDLLKRERPTLVAATGLLFEELFATADNMVLEKVLESYRNGVWGEEGLEGQGFPILRSTNTKGVRVEIADPAWRHVTPTKARECSLKTGDVLVTKSSGSTDLVGKAALFVHPEDGNTYLFSNFMMRLRPNQSTIIPEYLAWFLRSPQALAWRYESQQTTVGLRNLQTKEFLSQIIPVPLITIQKSVVAYLDTLESGNVKLETISLPMSLEEQQRIVAKIDELAAKIEEAHRLRQQVAIQVDAIVPNVSKNLFDPLRCERKPLKEVAEKKTGVAYKADDFIDSGNVPVVRLKEIITKTPVVYLRNPEAYVNVWLEAGDIVLAKTSFSTGSMCLWTGPRAVLNQNAVMLRVREGVEQKYLFIWLAQQVTRHMNDQLADPNFYPYIREADLMQWLVPVPSIPEQRQFVAYFDRVVERVELLKQVQAKTAAEIDALLPSILDKAFKGEL